MSEKAHCPNCDAEATKEGNKITCESCDAVFKITKDGSRIQSLGRIADHENRIRALEGTGQEPTAANIQDNDGNTEESDDEAVSQDDQGDQDQEGDLW